MPLLKIQSVALVALIMAFDAVLRISISKCLQEDSSVAEKQEVTSSPMIYMVTPTYLRASQMADLTRLSQVSTESFRQLL